MQADQMLQVQKIHRQFVLKAMKLEIKGPKIGPMNGDKVNKAEGIRASRGG